MLTVAVAVPLVVLELSVTGEPALMEQVGASPDWLAGPEVMEHVRVTLPE